MNSSRGFLKWPECSDCDCLRPLLTTSFLDTSYLHLHMHTEACPCPYQLRDKCTTTHAHKVLCDPLWSLHMTSFSWQQHSPCVRPLMDSTLSCLSTLNGQPSSWLSSLHVGVLSVRLGGCYSSWWFSQLVFSQVNWLAGTVGLFH